MENMKYFYYLEIQKKKNFQLKSFKKKLKQAIALFFHFKQNENLKIFVISITWRNLLNYLSIKFLKGKVSGYVYLRSDG